eukprot:IDg7059t1
MKGRSTTHGQPAEPISRQKNLSDPRPSPRPSTFSLLSQISPLTLRTCVCEPTDNWRCLCDRCRPQITTADDIEELFPNLLRELEPVWIKQENTAHEKDAEISIAGFAFIVTKVTFALKSRDSFSSNQ